MKVNNGKGGSGGGGGGGDGHTLPPSATSQDLIDATANEAKLFSPSQIASIVHNHKNIGGVDTTFISQTVHQVTQRQLVLADFDSPTNQIKMFAFGVTGDGHVELSISEADAPNMPDMFIVATRRDGEVRFIETDTGSDRYTNRDVQVIKNEQTAIVRRASDGFWSIEVNLGEDQLNVLNHFSYDADRNLISMDIALATTLSTVWLSDQWGYKSGGKSTFMYSTDQDMNFSPVVRGIKNQANPANQDASGIVAPFYRKYSDTLLQGSLKGDISTDPSDVTPYQGISVLTSHIAVFGVRAVLGESLSTGDRLWYRLWDGSDDMGDKLFEQSITVTADRAAGFDFTGWWSTPSEGFDEETVYARITVEPVDGSPTRTLMVRGTDQDPDVHWNELQYRTFEDVEIPLVAGATRHNVVLRSATAGNMQVAQSMDNTTLVMDTGGSVTLNSANLDNGFKLKIINPHVNQNRFINLTTFGSLVTHTGFASSGDGSHTGFSVRPNNSVTVTVNKVSAGQPILYLEDHNPVADLERRSGDDRLDASAIKNLGSNAKVGVTVIEGASSAIRHQDAAILQLDQFEEFVRFNVADMQDGFGYVTFDYHTTLASQQMNLTAVPTSLLGAPFAFNAAGVDGVGLIVGGQATRVSGQPVPYSIKVKYNLKNGLLRFLAESIGFVDEPTAYTEVVRNVSDNLPVSIVLRAQGSPSLADSVLITGAG